MFLFLHKMLQIAAKVPRQPGRPVWAGSAPQYRVFGQVKTKLSGGFKAMASQDQHCFGAADGLVCEKCRLLYEIRDDIPVMLIDEAKDIDGQGR